MSIPTSPDSPISETSIDTILNCPITLTTQQSLKAPADFLEHFHMVKEQYTQLQTEHKKIKRQEQKLTTKGDKWERKNIILKEKKVKMDKKWDTNNRKLDRLLQKASILTKMCEKMQQARLNKDGTIVM